MNKLLLIFVSVLLLFTKVSDAQAALIYDELNSGTGLIVSNQPGISQYVKIERLPALDFGVGIGRVDQDIDGDITIQTHTFNVVVDLPSSQMQNTFSTHLLDLRLTMNIAYSDTEIPNGDTSRYTARVNIPLYFHYDHIKGESYIYYNMAETSANSPLENPFIFEGKGPGDIQAGSTFDTISFTGYESLVLDLDDSGNEYKGWLIDDAMGSVGTSFDIGIAFSNIKTDPPAPTPEPTTMLLMGAGLAGLGVIKRRRQVA